MDLASFEMVRNFKLPLLQLLESGDIDLCFANEDEATELLRDEENADPEVALEFLAKRCQWAVVTLGPNGCIAKHGKEVVRVPAMEKQWLLMPLERVTYLQVDFIWIGKRITSRGMLQSWLMQWRICYTLYWRRGDSG
ncbi:hypothetical protein SLA2020_441910 [Shorea laevis]